MIAIRRLSIFDWIYLYLSTSLITTKNHIQHIYNYNHQTTTTTTTTTTKIRADEIPEI